MGTLDEIRDSLGDEFFKPRKGRQPAQSWHRLCPCGHLEKYHSPSIGGSYRVAAPDTYEFRGQTFTRSMTFHGCTGALGPRGFDKTSTVVDREALTSVIQVNTTCPCVDFREVAQVDRPNRYFNQKVPRDHTDFARHPFMIGLRALNTFLSNRKAALADPSWASEEFDRRFVWLDGKRRCAITRCASTDDVWPTYVNDDDRSELRCAAHR